METLLYSLVRKVSLIMTLPLETALFRKPYAVFYIILFQFDESN